MGEALMIKAVDGKSITGGSTSSALAWFTEDGNYLTPKSGNYKVLCIGGGGGGALMMAHSSSSTTAWINFPIGGCSGEIKTSTIYLEKGTFVPISVGSGGIGRQREQTDVVYNLGNGGISSFGTYLYANGGTGGSRYDANVFNNWLSLTKIGANWSNDNWFFGVYNNKNGVFYKSGGWVNTNISDIDENTGLGGTIYLDLGNLEASSIPKTSYINMGFGCGGDTVMVFGPYDTTNTAYNIFTRFNLHRFVNGRYISSGKDNADSGLVVVACID